MTNSYDEHRLSKVTTLIDMTHFTDYTFRLFLWQSWIYSSIVWEYYPQIYLIFVFIKYIYKYVISALGDQPTASALPPSPSNHTHPSLTLPPTRGLYKWKAKQSKETLYLLQRHSSWERSAPSPNEVKIHPHVTDAELSLDTVPTYDGANVFYY